MQIINKALSIMASFLNEIWILLLEMAPYLLLGFLIAGVLRLIIPRSLLYKHLAKGNISAIIKSSLFGVPLPLCSCGVIPVAAHLRKEGARRGPVLSFLTSTPTTGIDSILATYSLLGPLFAIIRPIVSFVLGIFTGTLSYLLDKEDSHSASDVNNFDCVICEIDQPHSHSIISKIKYIFHYAFIELMLDVGKWLIIGILIGGAIGAFIPDNFITSYFSNSALIYLFMLIVGIPLYVCATGSIPVAASFLKIGISPGAVLLFLIVGPATNAATMTFVAGKLGKRTLVIYLISIVIISVVSGIVFDYFWGDAFTNMAAIMAHGQMLPMWIKTISAILLLIFLVFVYTKGFFQKNAPIKEGVAFIISDMTCNNCKNKIESVLNKLDGVSKVNVNLSKKTVTVESNINIKDIKEAIIKAGYHIEETEY